MMRQAWPVLLLGLLLVAPPVSAEEDAQLKEELAGISGAKALELVKELAADGMKGRKTAFEGGALVENWMLGKMSEYGLHPADAAGTYLEPFTFQASQTKAPIALAVAGKKLAYGTDYFDLTYTGTGKVKAEAVFVGYGIRRPDLGWDDYAGLDVKGKVVIAIRGAPAVRATEFREERYIGYKSSTAADQGAAGFLLVQNEGASTGTIQARFHRGTLPALWISGAAADGIFASKGAKLADLKKSRDEGKPGKGFATGVEVAMEVNAKYLPNAKGHNALGAIKGRDPDLKDEIILVGAHMDGLGVGPDGQIFNGADDNASGTAVMMHLADVLTANRFRPKRTVIFCGFGAEEQGLHGSRALAARYPFQGKVVAVLNMDMVGQGKPTVRIGGVGSYPRMHELMKEVLPDKVEKQIAWGLRTGSGSDHWPFHERGVPAFMIHTQGKHPNYHTPKDDTEGIKADCLEAAARVVGSLIVKLATHEKPLHDPQGTARYLAFEGPRFGFGAVMDGKPALIDVSSGKAVVLKDDPRALASLMGLGALVWMVEPDAEGMKAWQGLVERAAGKDAGLAIVRQVADVGRAWRAGKLGLLPMGACAGTIAERIKQIEAYKQAGIRIVAPFSAMENPDALDEATMRKLLEACAEAGLLPDLGTLPPKRWGTARKLLGTLPAISLLFAPQVDKVPYEMFEQLGAETLLLVSGSAEVGLASAFAYEGKGPQAVVLDPFADRLVPLLHALCTKMLQEGWDLPGSDQRKFIRGALGGRLVEWLAKSER
ncbi:MAG: M20/M25/M40 family metallo-hydrolase [Planctomycetota bacterium]|nr:M20/M25/M40 family metallo-hydrolase [Planctomycetota bacterium]